MPCIEIFADAYINQYISTLLKTQDVSNKYPQNKKALPKEKEERKKREDMLHLFTLEVRVFFRRIFSAEKTSHPAPPPMEMEHQS